MLREPGVVRNVPRGRGRLLSLRRAELDVAFPGLLDSVLGCPTVPTVPTVPTKRRRD